MLGHRQGGLYPVRGLAEFRQAGWRLRLILAKPVTRRAACSYYAAAGVVVWGFQARSERGRTGLMFCPDWILLSYQQSTRPVLCWMSWPAVVFTLLTGEFQVSSVLRGCSCLGACGRWRATHSSGALFTVDTFNCTLAAISSGVLPWACI